MGQQTRPVIGINLDYIAPRKEKQGRYHIDAGYAESILHAGGLPVVMPLLNKESEIEAFLDRVDGFVLTGGGDMDPRRNGQAPHPAVTTMPEQRETNDRVLLRCIAEREMPVLGIGLGMQQINTFLGGDLYLHLPEDLPRAMPHFDPNDEGPHRHLVVVEPGTRLDEIYGGGELRVNSHHHQAVRKVAPKCRASAHAPDGVIEAIELDDNNWFCIGVQWHPESDTATALDMQLFECFVQASIRHAQPLQLAA